MPVLPVVAAGAGRSLSRLRDPLLVVAGKKGKRARVVNKRNAPPYEYLVTEFYPGVTFREFSSEMIIVCAHPHAAVKYRAVELLLFVCSPASECRGQGGPRTHPNYPTKYNEGKKIRKEKKNRATFPLPLSPAPPPIPSPLPSSRGKSRFAKRQTNQEPKENY